VLSHCERPKSSSPQTAWLPLRTQNRFQDEPSTLLSQLLVMNVLCLFHPPCDAQQGVLLLLIRSQKLQLSLLLQLCVPAISALQGPQRGDQQAAGWQGLRGHPQAPPDEHTLPGLPSAHFCCGLTWPAEGHRLLRPCSSGTVCSAMVLYE